MKYILLNIYIYIWIQKGEIKLNGYSFYHLEWKIKFVYFKILHDGGNFQMEQLSQEFSFFWEYVTMS
jgi:hypothetical protein